MSPATHPRLRVLLVAGLLVAAVLAQDVVPSWSGFHTWQYAAALTICAIPLLSYLLFARKARASPVDWDLALALIGVLLIGVAGLAAGLLGPDTIDDARAPGTVVPLPDLDAAAFFPNVNAEAIARGQAVLLIRRHDGTTLSLPPGARWFLGSYVVEAHPRQAAYLEVRDERGNHLTVTQPQGGAFLSPVLLFTSKVRLENQMFAADSFVVPAAQRQVEALSFPRKGPAVLFAVRTSAGHLAPGGIVLGPSGTEVSAGGLRLRATVGSYPSLRVSAIPAPAALWIGSGWFFLGILRLFRVGKKR